MTRMFLGALVVLMLGVTAPSALAAATSYDVHVSLSGAGNLTDAAGINCSRTISGVTSGTCSSCIAPECDTSGLKPVCYPGEDVVTAHDVASTGFTFDHWTGDCSGTATTCDLYDAGDKTVGAVFRDAQPPTVTLTSPGSGVRAGTISLTAGASDNVAVTRVEFRVGNVLRSTVTSAPYSTSFDTHTVPDGVTSVTATAYDTSGMMTVSTASQITVDNTAPALSLSGPNGQTFAGGTTQSWTIAGSDPTSGLASVQCSVVPAGSPASFGPCTGGTGAESVANKPEGNYTLTARATDGAGNKTDLTRTFAIDTTPPDTSFASGVADGATTVDTALTWGLASSEPGATFECRVHPAALTPGPFAPCSAAAAHTASGFAPGTYTIEARAIDAVGNIDPTPAKRTFTVAQATTTAPDPGPGGTSTGTPSDPAGPSSGGSGGILGAGAQHLIITLAYNFTANRHATHLKTLRVQDIPAGATVTVKCPRGCARKSFVKHGAHGSLSLTSLIKGRALKPGTRITVTASKPGATSAVKVLTIRARKSPAISTLCQAPKAAKPSACST